MMRTRALLAVVLGLAFFAATAEADPADDQAEAILQAAGVRGGLVVHLGCGEGRLTAALGARDACLVHGLDSGPANVARARAHIASKGPAGKVAVARLAGNHLPYVSNLVNLLVADDLGSAGMKEVLRVLAPGGVACVREAGGWKKTVKPRPDTIDEWTHYLHDATNNAVADDTVVGPPRHMRWLGSPWWTRNHHKLNSISSVVTAGGRLFTIVDEATAANMSVPGKWALLARDAFSGVTLWRKPLGSWASGRLRSRTMTRTPPTRAGWAAASGSSRPRTGPRPPRSACRTPWSGTVWLPRTASCTQPRRPARSCASGRSSGGPDPRAARPGKTGRGTATARPQRAASRPREPSDNLPRAAICRFPSTPTFPIFPGTPEKVSLTKDLRR